MSDTILTAPLVTAEEAAQIALGRKPAPEMITVDEFRARYGCEPTMTLNVSAAARDLSDDWDKRCAEHIYRTLNFP